jgi:hypothetical protein
MALSILAVALIALDLAFKAPTFVLIDVIAKPFSLICYSWVNGRKWKLFRKIFKKVGFGIIFAFLGWGAAGITAAPSLVVAYWIN